jgi:hypothetical protein
MSGLNPNGPGIIAAYLLRSHQRSTDSDDGLGPDDSGAVASVQGMTSSSGPDSSMANPNWPDFINEDGSPPEALTARGHVSVVGVLDANNIWRVYKISVDPDTAALKIELSPKSVTPPWLDHMTLLDGSGRTIADTMSGPDAEPAEMNVAMDPRTRVSGGVFYLRVESAVSSSDVSSDSEMQPESFLLQVTQETQNSSVIFQKLSPTFSAFGPMSAVIPQSNLPKETTSQSSTSAESTLLESAVGSLGPMLVPSSISAGTSQLPQLNTVATGPLPEREAAALGGVLDEGDPVPQLDRHDPALVDLALIGLPARAGGVDGRADDEDDEELSDSPSGLDLVPEDANPVVAIRGPGGFPQLTSSLRNIRPLDSEALIAVLPATAVASNAMAAPAKAGAGSRPDAVQSAPFQRPRGVRPGRTLSGLSLAMAMVFGLMLPDLASLLTVAEPPRFRFRAGAWLRRKRARSGDRT